MNSESNTTRDPDRNACHLEKKTRARTFYLGVCWGVLLILLAQILLFHVGRWMIERDPPVPEWQMEKLKSKPRMEVVEDLLGKPLDVFKRDTEIEYVYARPLQLKSLRIIFDLEGNMKEYHIND